ncbi:MAG: hypothetical protein ACYDAQ_19510, partial [Mycobacteriales bacterium]
MTRRRRLAGAAAPTFLVPDVPAPQVGEGDGRLGEADGRPSGEDGEDGDLPSGGQRRRRGRRGRGRGRG